MDDGKKFYERLFLAIKPRNGIDDFRNEWNAEEILALRFRIFDGKPLPGDAELVRELAQKLERRLMDVADDIDALNNFDANHS